MAGHSHLLTEPGSAQFTPGRGAGNSHGTAGHRQGEERSTQVPAPTQRKRCAMNSADPRQSNSHNRNAPSQEAQICMDSDTQNQVQVECRKTQTGDSDEIAGARNYRIECFARPGARTGSSASAHRCRHRIRCITSKIQGTSGKGLEPTDDKGTRSHG